MDTVNKNQHLSITLNIVTTRQPEKLVKKGFIDLRW